MKSGKFLFSHFTAEGPIHPGTGMYGEPEHYSPAIVSKNHLKILSAKKDVNARLIFSEKIKKQVNQNFIPKQ
jgi:hypothetical protein